MRRKRKVDELAVPHNLTLCREKWDHTNPFLALRSGKTRARSSYGAGGLDRTGWNKVLCMGVQTSIVPLALS